MQDVKSSMRPVSLNIVVCLVLVACATIYLGSALNGNQHKYSRFSSSQCSHGLLINELRASDFCCDHMYHRSDWACVAAYDRPTQIMSSIWAWALPLMPAALTIISDAFFGVLNRKYKAHFKRISLYLSIFIFRTVVLYVFGGLLEMSVQDPPHSDCWYSHLVHSGRCRDNFDYSDHIVLFLAHFLIPCALELTYVIHSTTYATPLPASAPTTWAYTASIVASVSMIGMCLRSMLFTAMYFHTTTENTVALKIFFVLILLPLYYTRQTSAFKSMF
mmetsp:Transcript_10896/g.16605  ORF Transcript_10896/g.16605 Transcript_10896/m.16605 type:complete len:275 (+) Transcript_10896:35-859(+)